MCNRPISIAAALASLFAVTAAHAGSIPTPIPEPGTWALVGLAAAIGWAVMHKRK